VRYWRVRGRCGGGHTHGLAHNSAYRHAHGHAYHHAHGHAYHHAHGHDHGDAPADEHDHQHANHDTTRHGGYGHKANCHHDDARGHAYSHDRFVIHAHVVIHTAYRSGLGNTFSITACYPYGHNHCRTDRRHDSRVTHDLHEHGADHDHTTHPVRHRHADLVCNPDQHPDQYIHEYAVPDPNLDGDEHLDAHAQRHATVGHIGDDQRCAGNCHTITVFYPECHEGDTDGDAAISHRRRAIHGNAFDPSAASSGDQHSFTKTYAPRGHDPLLCRRGGGGNGAHHPGAAQPYAPPGNGTLDLLRRWRRDGEPPADGRAAGAQAGRGGGPHRP